MKLLTAALVIILLTTTSAKPFHPHRRHDADISDSHMRRRWPDGHNRIWRPAGSSSYENSSPESEESTQSSDSSQSASSDDSSEEVTDQTTPPVTTDAVTTTAVTTAAITTVTMEDNSTITPEPGTMNTDMPIETTPVTMAPGNVTLCVTKDIPTGPPITENRGDN